MFKPISSVVVLLSCYQLNEIKPFERFLTFKNVIKCNICCHLKHLNVYGGGLNDSSAHTADSTLE